MKDVLGRVDTARGELVLRRDGEHFEIISNGVFLMDTRNGESERRLVDAALSRLGGSGWRVLIGGLGMGFSLIEALSHEAVTEVTVLEIEPTMIDWHHERLTDLTGAALADERTKVVVADLLAYLAGTEVSFDAICLDVDNGPDWTVTDANAGLYADDGTALLARRLRPGGVMTLWSAARSSAYEQVLRRHFGKVDIIEIPVPRGEPDVVFAAAGPVAQTQGRDSDSS